VMDLKKSYQKHLYGFLFLNIILYLGFILGLSFDNMASIDNLSKGVFMVFAPLVLLLLNGLLPSKYKEILVFWRFKKVLAGNRAFSIYAKQDERIDLDVLKKQYPEIQTTQFDENKVWYRIYQKHKNDPSVWDGHRNYLLTRDMTFIAFLSMLLSGLLVFDVVFFSILLVEYIVLVWVCRNYAVRFVQSVLAVESATCQIKQ